jgi:hypothetical protein
VCALTGARFAMPSDAPVPALFTDRVAGGELQDRDPVDPLADTIHPALVCAGPEAVAAALWSRNARAIEALGAQLVEAARILTLAVATGPAEIGGMETQFALADTREEVTETGLQATRSPAGWRGVYYETLA